MHEQEKRDVLAKEGKVRRQTAAGWDEHKGREVLGTTKISDTLNLTCEKLWKD